MSSANNRCVQDLLSLAHDLIDLTPAYSGIRKRAEAVLAANGLPLQREEAGGDRDVRLTPAMIQHLAQVSAENPGTDLILRPDAPAGDEPVSVSVFAPAWSIASTPPDRL